MRSPRRQLTEDVIYILLSIAVSFIAVKTGFVNGAVGALGDYAIVGIFIGGIFFTSIFTTVPAIALLGGFALNSDIFVLIFVGALGATLGNYLIFCFMKDRIADDVEFIAHVTHEEKLFSIFKKRIFRWIVPFIGALIIASPFPDELGVAMLGLSKTKSTNFIIIAFLFSAVGIAIIGIVARSAV
jgi:membrane protein YqaA with SNARE-associated domain